MLALIAIGESLIEFGVEHAVETVFDILLKGLALPILRWASDTLTEANNTQVFVTSDGGLAPAFHPAYSRMLWFGMVSLIAVSTWELVAGSMQGGMEGARRALVRIASFVVFLGWFAPVTMLVTNAIDVAALEAVKELDTQLEQIRTYIETQKPSVEQMPMLFISTMGLSFALMVAAFQAWAHQFFYATLLVIAPIGAALRGEKAMVKMAIGNAAFFPILMMCISVGVESGITRNDKNAVVAVSSWPVLLSVVMSLFAFPLIGRMLESVGADGQIAQQQIHAGQQAFKMYTGPSKMYTGPRSYVRGRRAALNQRYTAIYGRPLEPGQAHHSNYDSKAGKFIARRWNNRELAHDPVGRFALRAVRSPRNAYRAIRRRDKKNEKVWIDRQPETRQDQADRHHEVVMTRDDRARRQRERLARGNSSQQEQLAEDSRDQRDRLAQAANMLQQTLHDSRSEQSETHHTTGQATSATQHQQVMNRLDQPITTTRATGQGRRRGGGGNSNNGGGGGRRRRR